MTTYQNRRKHHRNRRRNSRRNHFNHVDFLYGVAASAIAFTISTILVMGVLVN